MPTYDEVPADLEAEAEERADSARGCTAWIFARALAKESLNKLAEERFLADEILGTTEKDDRLFFFFTDSTCLVLDNIEGKTVIIDAHSCFASIAGSYLNDESYSRIIVAAKEMDS